MIIINLFTRLFDSTKTVRKQLFKLGELISIQIINIMLLEFDIFHACMIGYFYIKLIINSPLIIITTWHPIFP